jgi:hypothetical protein
MWIIAGHPEEDPFLSQEMAVARAWELTPAGQARPEVMLQGMSLGTVPADLATGGHLHVTLQQINNAITQATEIRMNPWGREVDLETLRVYAHWGQEIIYNTPIKDDCLGDLRQQAAIHGVTFNEGEVNWHFEHVMGQATRVRAQVTAHG